MTETQITATMVRHHWLPLKRRSIKGNVTWISQDGITVTSTGQLPLGARVTMEICSAEHRLNQIPAEIVRAEPGVNGTRYSLRFHKQRISQDAGDITLRLLGHLSKHFAP